ncbi:MAG: hypothetical protein P4M00_01085 [Azospirillaceae bacterium]|nr:hypothetical protein [Azospirillaceae bacterium]
MSSPAGIWVCDGPHRSPVSPYRDARPPDDPFSDRCIIAMIAIISIPILLDLEIFCDLLH